jgi:hypothetical protein
MVPPAILASLVPAASKTGWQLRANNGLASRFKQTLWARLEAKSLHSVELPHPDNSFLHSLSLIVCKKHCRYALLVGEQISNAQCTTAAIFAFASFYWS